MDGFKALIPVGRITYYGRISDPIYYFFSYGYRSGYFKIAGIEEQISISADQIDGVFTHSVVLKTMGDIGWIALARVAAGKPITDASHLYHLRRLAGLYPWMIRLHETGGKWGEPYQCHAALTSLGIGEFGQLKRCRERRAREANK